MLISCSAAAAAAMVSERVQAATVLAAEMAKDSVVADG